MMYNDNNPQRPDDPYAPYTPFLDSDAPPPDFLNGLVIPPEELAGDEIWMPFAESVPLVTHSQNDGVHHAHAMQAVTPAAETSAGPSVKQRKRSLLFPALALCLCFTLLGGGLGGWAVLHLYAPPPALSETLDGAPAENASAADGPADPDVVKPVVFQPGRELSPSRIFDLCNLGVVAISTESAAYNVFGRPSTQASAGSGFVISGDGYIVTNNHVIDGTDSIKVMLATGESYEAKLIGRDPANDLAVLKIEAQNLSALTWGDSASLSVGDPIVAIGNPLGELANSATSGIVSALDRAINIDGTPMTMLQIDASVSPGNSGGPLIGPYGQVIGIVSAKSSGTGVEGIGFAIPSDIARELVEQLIAHGYVTGRPQLGIKIEAVDETMSRYYNLPVGVYVVSVDPGSCSQKAGLQTGDVIVGFGGAKVTTRESLIGQKNAHKAGETVEVKIVRAGNEMTLNVTLDESLPESEVQAPADGRMMPWMPPEEEAM